MRKKIHLIFVMLFLVLVSFEGRNDYVPDKKTAIRIAEAIWLPIYGTNIYEKKPFNSKLIGDTIWHIYGSLPKSGYKIGSNGDTISYRMVLGGVPHIYIYKSNAEVLKVYHSK